jgi:hypothetical protein
MPRNKQNACKYEVWSFHQGRLDELKGDTAEKLFEAVCNKRLFSQDFQKKLKDLEDAAEELSALCPGEIGLINKDELSKPKAEGKV